MLAELNGEEPPSLLVELESARGFTDHNATGKTSLTKVPLPPISGSKVAPETSASGVSASGLEALAKKLSEKMPVVSEDLDSLKLCTWLQRLTRIPDQKLQCEAYKSIFQLKRGKMSSVRVGISTRRG